MDFTSNYLTYAWLSAFLRPVIVILQMRDVRSFTLRYTRVMRVSMPMVCFIGIYMLYFAWMGEVIFAGTIQGVESFPNFNEAFYSMFILLTTANFPTIMLPSYDS